MKKIKFISFCLILLCLSFLPTNKCMAATKLEPLDNSVHFTNNIIDDNCIDISKKVQPLIENYFDWYNQNMKDNLAYWDELDDLVNNDDLINFKKSKVKWYYNFHKELEVNLKSYTVTVDLNSIEEYDEYINVNVIYGEKLITENAEDFTQETQGQKHNLKIQNIDNTYVIVNDYYSDDLMGENFSASNVLVSKDNISLNSTEDNINIKMQKKESEFNDKLNNLKLEVDKVKKETIPDSQIITNYLAKSNVNAYRFTGYSPSRAVQYALTYVDQYNPYFFYYKDNDCQNFVSQCLDYGYIPRDVAWQPGKYAWYNVIGFEDWANRQKDFARTLYWREKATLGDVVQLGGNGSNWHHSMIITKKDSNNSLYVTAHSDNVKHRYLPDIAEQKRYLIFTS